MRTRTRLLAFAIPLFVCLCAAAGARQKPSAAAQRSGGAVVFAVSKYESGVTAEPVVIYRGGAYVKPPVDDAGSRRFVADYFRPGRRMRLISGGGDAGTLTMVKYQEPGCTGLVADAKVETQARIGGRVQALATDSQTLGRGDSSRRAPTDAERGRALELARAAYAKNGVGAGLAAKIEVDNLTATDLDRDGKFELLGSFRVDQEGAAPNSYTLFLIMEPAGDSFKTAWEWFHKGYEGDYADRHFVDQVDFDGDGVGEVVVEGTYYESNDYAIYKRQQGRWRPVYQGGGGGC